MVLEGLTAVLQPLTIALVALGTIVGIIFGSIPGLTATMAVVMFLPVTYSMTSSQGISMLMALYIGGISGGLISAILLNIPGTPSSVATCFDGKPMADKGEAGKALGTGVVFSFIGTIIGLILLIVLSPVLCNFALKFQAYEYCALAIFSLSMVIALTGHDRHAQGPDQRRAGRAAGHGRSCADRLQAPLYLRSVPAQQRLRPGGAADRPVRHLRDHGRCRQLQRDGAVIFKVRMQAKGEPEEIFRLWGQFLGAERCGNQFTVLHHIAVPRECAVFAGTQGFADFTKVQHLEHIVG